MKFIFYAFVINNQVLLYLYCNLCKRIKKLPHISVRIHGSPRYIQCIHVGSHKLKLPKTFNTLQPYCQVSIQLH